MAHSPRPPGGAAGAGEAGAWAERLEQAARETHTLVRRQLAGLDHAWESAWASAAGGHAASLRHLHAELHTLRRSHEELAARLRQLERLGQ